MANPHLFQSGDVGLGGLLMKQVGCHELGANINYAQHCKLAVCWLEVENVSLNHFVEGLGLWHG